MTTTPRARDLRRFAESTLALAAVGWMLIGCRAEPSAPGLPSADANTPSDANVVDGAPEADGELPDADVGPEECDAYAAVTATNAKSALYAFVRDHTSLGYDRARDAMYGSGGVDDFGGVIESVYTNDTAAPDGTRTPGNLNTEHSWPQSDGADKEPAQSDLHHLFPCDQTANSQRSNHPFGQTTCTGNSCSWARDGSELGQATGGQTVFEVRTSRRGDIARAHFYFAVRYQIGIDSAEEATLRQWHAQDPVDDRERTRHARIVNLQKKRNPFVDCPSLVDLVDNF